MKRDKTEELLLKARACDGDAFVELMELHKQSMYKVAKAYLKRIGYTEDIQKDKETLNGLIRAHLEQVPFENLDVCEFGEVPSLDEGKLFEKIVEKEPGRLLL